MRITQCECRESGWCPRHHTLKSSNLYEICQRLPTLFDLWEHGRGPGQIPSMTTVRESRCQSRSVDATDTVECEGCGGLKRRIPVFDCERHGRCVLYTCSTSTASLGVAAVCHTCRDYAPQDNRTELDNVTSDSTSLI